MSSSAISIPAFKIQQPIGELFIGRMTAREIVAVAFADVREMEENELDKYIGINRRLTKNRVDELSRYVQTYDATFPTSIIVAVPDENAEFDETENLLTIRATRKTPLKKVAKIIDGQHRIAGLRAVPDGTDFEVCVAIIIGADIATQANVFATVNLAQTKVNRSLAYDLLEYEGRRSPQKSAHDVAVALDQMEGSPFYRRIKRLGRATEGRRGETLTQAVVVEMLLELMTDDPMADRDSFLRRVRIARPTAAELRRRPFRAMFQRDRDEEIAGIVYRYFCAVRNRWPQSWDDLDRRGNALPKTNGFRALMRFLKPVYLGMVGDGADRVPEVEEFESILERVPLEDEDFNVETFPPGTSGESRFRQLLVLALGNDD